MKKVILFLVYILVVANTSFAQRSLSFQNSPNFRELGGVQVNESLKVKEGIIFRSGSFPVLTDEEKKVFVSSNINTVVDFRSDSERAKEPDYIPEGMNVRVVHAPIGSLDEKGMAKFMQVLMNPKVQVSQIDSLMIQANKGFVASIKDFAPFFQEISKPESVVLFHCTAGKDRTGLASSLFLHILGCSWETIMQDFLTSNEAQPTATIKALERYGIAKDKIDVLAGVKPSYLESAWYEINQRYKSVDNLLIQEFGIGEAEKQIIRNKYLK